MFNFKEIKLNFYIIFKKAIDYDDIHNSDDEEKLAVNDKKRREEAAKERLEKIE